MTDLDLSSGSAVRDLKRNDAEVILSLTFKQKTTRMWRTQTSWVWLSYALMSGERKKQFSLLSPTQSAVFSARVWLISSVILTIHLPEYLTEMLLTLYHIQVFLYFAIFNFRSIIFKT